MKNYSFFKYYVGGAALHVRYFFGSIGDWVIEHIKAANQLDRYVEELKEQGITDEDLRACSNDYVLANTIGLEES